MSVIQVECPRCRARYRVKAEHVGRRAKCAKCSGIFTVVAPSETHCDVSDGEPDILIACRYCGFQDWGKFCSNCGGRLASLPDYDFEKCKIADSFIARYPAELTYDLDAPPQTQAEHRRLYEIRQQCEYFNSQIDEMARVIKYKGGDADHWQFDRLQVGRLADSLPAEVAGRDDIIARLWTIISDIEAATAERTFEQLAFELQECFSKAEVKKAAKLIEKLRRAAEDCRDPASARTLRELEGAFEDLRSKEIGDKQTASFQKLLDKADKHAFQADFKKAMKAYQECLFWLSRNDLPSKERFQGEIEQKLRAAQERVSSSQ